MSKFPLTTYGTASAYGAEYFHTLAKAAQRIDLKQVDKAASILLNAVNAGNRIYSCGNGGSAAIADHLCCDVLKGVRTGTDLKPDVTSLVSTVSLITAISNDIGYDAVFRYQLESIAKAGDVLITISSSGNSPNIVHAVEWAKANGVSTIALTGFEGGQSARLADVSIHVPAENYGVVEDIHQSIMHMLAQYLRQAHMDPKAVPATKF